MENRNIEDRTRNYLIGRITEAASRMRLGDLTIKTIRNSRIIAGPTYNLSNGKLDVIKNYSNTELRDIWDVLSMKYVSFLMELAEKVA